MVVIWRTRNGTYHLAELDGMVLKLCYTTFQLVPYLACSQLSIPVTCILDHEDLATVIADDIPSPTDAADGYDKN
jgi:hypothetical protein